MSFVLFVVSRFSGVPFLCDPLRPLRLRRWCAEHTLPALADATPDSFLTRLPAAFVVRFPFESLGLGLFVDFLDPFLGPFGGEIQVGIFAVELDGPEVGDLGGLDLAGIAADHYGSAILPDVGLVLAPFLIVGDALESGGPGSGSVVVIVLALGADPQIALAVVQNVLKSSLFHKYS